MAKRKVQKQMKIPGVSAKDVTLDEEVLGQIKVVKEVATVVTGEWNGLPYVGPNLTLKKTDSPDKQPQLDIVSRAKIFHVDEAADMKEYESVLQKHYVSQAKARNGFVPQTAILSKDLRYNEATGKRSIMLEWYEAKYVAPKKAV